MIRDYDNDLPSVLCDAGKLQQVFFNILKNGAHAMVKNKKDRQPVFKLSVRKKSDCIAVAIEDNGPGMDEKIRTRIFEPFFTTKPVGVGTGLGLYISYFIIVENHKGSINVESFPGRGTIFTIELPFEPAKAG